MSRKLSICEGMVFCISIYSFNNYGGNSNLFSTAEHQDKLVPILKEMKTVTDLVIAWCTFNVSLAGTIIVVRETFKVKKLTALNDEETDNTEVIKDMKA